MKPVDRLTMSPETPTHHKIQSIIVTGGFLDGVQLQFFDGMNCIIGGRGTGKTTVLEAIRYVLDRLPDPEQDRDRYRTIDRLLQNNLAGANVTVELETSEGVRYTVIRSLGQAPLVMNEDGKPTAISIGKNILFDIDIFSQSQIEEMANDALSQLGLIDRFVQRDVDEISRQLSETTQDLTSNASKVLEVRRAVDDLIEATKELPDVEEKIRGFEKSENSGGNALMRRENELTRMRTREARFVEDVGALYSQGVDGITSVIQSLGQKLKTASRVDLTAAANQEVVALARVAAERAVEDAAFQLEQAKTTLLQAKSELLSIQARLIDQHGLQEKHYREIAERHEQERARGAEFSQLEERHASLRMKEQELKERREDLHEIIATRALLRARLSDQRDELYALRTGVAERLNKHLSPMIRVQVQQFGNMEPYRALLNRAMKGSGLRYGAVVDRIVERVPPAEFVVLIQTENRSALERELEIDADRATRLIIQLKDKPDIFAIEIVSLPDRPILELKDGPDYKDSASLSTGQKCTAVLPILLMESERPLLIDQPEDNLDNAFVFETIVPSVREVRQRRQLIFVTHNPNIPVLGDADRIFALRSTGRTARVESTGSVDEVAQELITILEGGRAAFEARQKRYGRPIPVDSKES